MASDEWRAASDEWPVASGEWRVASGEWRVASGEWRVASGEWRVASGEWRVLEVASEGEAKEGFRSGIAIFIEMWGTAGTCRSSSAEAAANVIADRRNYWAFVRSTTVSVFPDYLSSESRDDMNLAVLEIGLLVPPLPHRSGRVA